VLQNLSQTPVLRELLKEAKMPGTTVKIESPELSMVMCFDLHSACPHFPVFQLYFIINVSFNRAIRFKGYQQQDSHELLRYLLDGMRTEE
ncbi:UBP16 hydrolase, partial [Neodrepanis coruscans]|nr:UBP16 hydrolase [Neodrepanis coruscans]